MLQFPVIASLIQFALHLVQIADFVISQIPYTIKELPLRFTVDVIQRLQLFHKHFATRRPSYLSQRFPTLIRQSKVLYFTASMSSLCEL